MKYLFPLIVLFLAGFKPASAAETTRDSLHTALLRTNNPKEQIRIYRDLADLTYETSESCGYLMKLIEKARAAGEIRPMMEALTDISLTYMLLEKLDSARYFISQAEQYTPKEQRDQWCCYLEMRMTETELFSDNAEKAMDEVIEEFKMREIDKESRYRQIQAEYTIGSAIYYSTDTEPEIKNQDALKHMLHAFDLSKQLPFRDGYLYQLQCLRQLTRVYTAMRDFPQVKDYVLKSIETKEKYYDLYDKEQRPFYPLDDFYITSYTSMMLNITILNQEEIEFYLKRLREMCDRSTKPTHKYNCFLTLANYYAVKRDFHKAMEYNDSLLVYARLVAPYNIAGIYRTKSAIYELFLKQPENALANLKLSYKIKDSLQQNDMQEQLNKMRVEYDVNRLNYENSQLEIRNKHLIVIGLLIVLGLALSLCIYLYMYLKREQHRKEQMQKLKMQAEESEKLKTAFINSMCHEIRTPLNGIVGFSALITDPTIEEEVRNTLPQEIQRSSDELLGIMDCLLEVSTLDISQEKLPCDPMNINGLCRTVCDYFAETNTSKPIEITANIPEEPLIISTNKRYLSMVFENLLANAYKFTEQGYISMECIPQEHDVLITISDSGCGIPEEKREMVFDRFIKLDTYSTGGGLGLYLCKRIVQRLAGKIYIDPTYSNGTRVVVILPRK